MKRVFCLYRGKTEEDINRQRIACEIYAGLQGWIIQKEFSETCDDDDVSGDAVNFDDAISILRYAALDHGFDVLLVYEYDNIGRDKEETPLAVAWFTDNNIDVVSVKYENRDFNGERSRLVRKSEIKL